LESIAKKAVHVSMAVAINIGSVQKKKFGMSKKMGTILMPEALYEERFAGEN
jgi:hypothetical protein